MMSHSHLCPKSSHGHQRHLRTSFFIFLNVGSGAFVFVDRPWNTRDVLGPFRVKLLEWWKHSLWSWQRPCRVYKHSRWLARRHGRICRRKRSDWDEVLVNGRLVLTHGTSGGLLSSMAWRDWSVVFRSYAALVHPALKDEMQRVERLSIAETNAGLVEAEQVQASTDHYHLLLHSTSGPALDRVVNAGSAEGLCASKLLEQRYDPHIRSRTARQLVSLLQFDFT